MEREKDVLSNTYAFIRQKMEEVRVSMASEPGKVRIINKAEQASVPKSPDIPRNLIMALILGALMGFVINISIEYFDNTVKSVEFIERKKLPVLAIIPSIDHKSKIYSNKREKNGDKSLNDTFENGCASQTIGAQSNSQDEQNFKNETLFPFENLCSGVACALVGVDALMKGALMLKNMRTID